MVLLNERCILRKHHSVSCERSLTVSAVFTTGSISFICSLLTSLVTFQRYHQTHLLLSKIDEILKINVISISVDDLVCKRLFQNRLKGVREYKAHDGYGHLQKKQDQQTQWILFKHTCKHYQDLYVWVRKWTQFVSLIWSLILTDLVEYDRLTPSLRMVFLISEMYMQVQDIVDDKSTWI